MQSFKTLFAPRDMTQGSPMKSILLFSIPLLIGNLVQQLYSTVDAIVVGHYVGDHALGAVGLSFPILNLMLVLFIGISSGAGIIVSQYFGAKDHAALSRSVGTLLVLTFWSSLFIMVISLLGVRPLLVLLKTPPEMITFAADYLIIVAAGFIGTAYYNILSGILRGLGDSATPLLSLVLAASLNVVLDIVFVAYFHMGTAGAALATIISQVISSVICFSKLRNMQDILIINKKTLKMDKPITRRIVQLGVPSGVAQMIFSFSSVLVQSLTNTLGPLVITAATAVMRVDGFAIMPSFTFSIAATTFTGQNVGARKMERVRQGALATLKLATAVSVFITIGILCFGTSLMAVFTQTPALVDMGVVMFRVLAFGYIVFGVTQTLMGVMRGAGDTVIPMWISILTTVVIRLPIAYIWAWMTKSPEFPNGHWMCLYGSLLLAWVLGCAITIFFYRKGTWKRRCYAEMERAATTEEGE